MADIGTHHFVTAPDGLKLHVRVYGPHTNGGTAVVCLPGLGRTTADFDVLAAALARNGEGRRAVLALDSRGRGESDYDRDAGNYNLKVELADLLAVLTAMEIGRAVFIGTSRGGLLAMLLAAARPGAIAGVVLNDIGPVIEPKGLVRIKSYLGRLPLPRNFEDGAEVLRRLFNAQFPRLSTEDWIAFARRTFREKDGRLLPCYDLGLAKALAAVQPERPLPTMWKEFEALAPMPLMIVRGANSDILSAATVAAMLARRPDLDVLEVPDQGHAPLLAEDDVVARIEAFVARCWRAPAREPGTKNPGGRTRQG
jgi:pimeloyl-ACP methyl ester carboxylesterase